MSRYRHAIAALTGLTLITACATTDAKMPPTGSYVVSSIDGTPAPDGTTMQIAEDNRISGQGPCNNYSAQITDQNGALAIIGMAQTRKACFDQARSAGDIRFAAALQSVTRYQAADGGLALIDPEGTPRILLQPAQN